jgi:DNA-binding transcriptional LysR family regulator
MEILPPALAAFRKSVPTTKVLLYELSNDKLISGLRDGKLDLAIIFQLKARRPQASSLNCSALILWVWGWLLRTLSLV